MVNLAIIVAEICENLSQNLHIKFIHKNEIKIRWQMTNRQVPNKPILVILGVTVVEHTCDSSDRIQKTQLSEKSSFPSVVGWNVPLKIVF